MSLSILIHQSFCLVMLISLKIFEAAALNLTISPEHLQVGMNSTAVTFTCTADVAITACQLTWHNYWTDNKAGALLELSRGQQSQINSTHLDEDLTSYSYSGRGLGAGDCGVTLQVEGYKVWVVGCRVRAAQGGWKYAWTELAADNWGSFPVTERTREVVVLPGGDASLLCRAPGPLESCNFFPRSVSVLIFTEGPLSNDSTGRHLYHGAGLASGECGLTIRNVGEKDNGPVACYVWTLPKSAVRYIPVIVARAPSSPVLTVVYQGKHLLASCRVGDSRPVADITWLLGDKIIRQDGVDDAPAGIWDDWQWPWDVSSIIQNMTFNLGPGDGSKILTCRVQHVALAEPVEATHVINVTN